MLNVEDGKFLSIKKCMEIQICFGISILRKKLSLVNINDLNENKKSLLFEFVVTSLRRRIN